MKKLFPILVVAAGAIAYTVVSQNKKKRNSIKKISTIDNDHIKQNNVVENNNQFKANQNEEYSFNDNDSTIDLQSKESQNEPSSIDEILEDLNDKITSLETDEHKEDFKENLTQISKQINSNDEIHEFDDYDQNIGFFNDIIEDEVVRDYDNDNIDPVSIIENKINALKGTENDIEEKPFELKDIAELNAILKDFENIKNLTGMYPDEVAEYNIKYPYLSFKFIEDTLQLKNQLISDADNNDLNIEHFVRFSSMDEMISFVEIIKQHGYMVDEGDSDDQLLIIKKLANDSDTIITDVFNVANQVYCLNGDYLKFRLTR